MPLDLPNHSMIYVSQQSLGSVVKILLWINSRLFIPLACLSSYNNIILS